MVESVQRLMMATCVSAQMDMEGNGARLVSDIMGHIFEVKFDFQGCEKELEKLFRYICLIFAKNIDSGRSLETFQ